MNKWKYTLYLALGIEATGNCLFVRECPFPPHFSPFLITQASFKILSLTPPAGLGFPHPLVPVTVTSVLCADCLCFSLPREIVDFLMTETVVIISGPQAPAAVTGT